MFPPSSSGFAFAVHAQGAQSAKAHEAVFIKRRLAGKTHKKRDAQSPKNFQSLVIFLRVPAPRTDSPWELREQRFVLPACFSPTSAFSSRFDSHSCGCFEPLSCTPSPARDSLGTKKTHFHGIQGAIGTGEPRGRAVRGRDEERRVPCSDSNCSAGRGCTKRPPTCRRVVAQETRVNWRVLLHHLPQLMGDAPPPSRRLRPAR